MSNLCNCPIFNRSRPTSLLYNIGPMLFLWGLALTMIKSAIRVTGLLKLVTLKVWFAGFDSE